MVNISVLLITLLGAPNFDDFYSIRLQGLGTELAGIVSDEETDALFYPAQVPTYTNHFLSASSINGLSLFFLIPSRLSIGGLVSANYYYSFASKDFHNIQTSFSSAFILGYHMWPSLSLGLVPQFQQNKFDQQYLYSESFYSFTQKFTARLTLLVLGSSWRFDNVIFIRSIQKHDSIFYDKSSPDTNLHIHYDINIYSQGLNLQPTLRFSFLSQNNWTWKLLVTPFLLWQKSNIDSVAFEKGISNLDVATSYTKEIFVFSDFNVKLGTEWSSKNLNLAAGFSFSHLPSRKYFVASFPIGIEYFAGHFVFRLGLGTRHEKYFKNQYLKEFFSFGIGFLPKEWLNINFVAYPREIINVNAWKAEVKILW